MNKIEFGDCRETMRRWAQEGVKVQTCVTSPPYYGLRDYGHEGQLGLEETPEQYIANMVEVFRCVKDILADDGTLWVNIGDSYAGSGKGPSKSLNQEHHNMEDVHSKIVPTGCKQKDLIGIPWMLAFALRADGWYLRQDIIWHKPNPMPESVQDRCTKAHEYIFLLSKSQKYFYDADAIAEPSTYAGDDRGSRADSRRGTEANSMSGVTGITRNKRSVWTVTTKPYDGAHFAVFPTDLIEPAILAGTSRNGHCPKCNSRWIRIKEETGEKVELENYTGQATKDYEGNNVQNPSETKRRILESMSKVYEHKWISSCSCNVDPVPDVVLDPFMGSGTTAQVAQNLGRQYMGCELNPEYKALQDKRLRQLALELV